MTIIAGDKKFLRLVMVSLLLQKMATKKDPEQTFCLTYQVPIKMPITLTRKKTMFNQLRVIILS
ncbi:hypothetical protein TQ39_08885 [Ruthenibacterium lactatiformans]|uniref:Uncharacterized protein n=1 Tax=Ruthenibacterium lactatiformans TaxID=1550024 RepID=A0A0D8J2P6_9FIRM|nr:hypothetical protein TQ39_08885 [Ruthenibacterium lactatiformans]